MMRRVAHLLFTVLSFVSLLIAVAAVALWGRGYFAQDEWRWSGHRLVRDVFAEGDAYVRQSAWFATSGRGGLAVGRGTTWFEHDLQRDAPPPDRTHLVHDRYDAAYPIYPADEEPEGGVQYTLGGFQFRAQREGAQDGEPRVVNDEVVMVKPRVPRDRDELVVVAPLWAVVAAALAAPAAWLVSHHRRRRASRRRERGECLRCGYDLRSGGGHPRYPECGTDAVGGNPAVARPP